MEIERAIEILGEIESGVITFNKETKQAILMGKKALAQIAYGKGILWDDKTLMLILDATRQIKKEN